MSRRRNPTLSPSLHPALRAADGAPYFSDEALEEANREGDAYKSRTALVLMDPADFLRMADPGKEEARQVALERVLREGTRLSDVPRLFVDYDETSGVAVVTGHEGRHRSRSLLARGVKQMPVRIHSTNIRWSEQTSPRAWDYIEVLPHTLAGEGGHAHNRMRMPVPIHYPALAERMMKKNPTLTLTRYATREEVEAASNRFFDALEARAGEKQTMYAGPFVVVGDRKGGVLGNLEVSVGGSSTLEAREPVVRLSFIGVSPDQRGEGRGTALLNLVTSAADDAGLAVELDVDPQTMRGEKKPPMNKAALRAFYKKAGFAAVRGMGSDFMRRPVTKRNPRRRNPRARYVYHLTYASDLPFIARQGLVPRTDTEEAWDNEPGVYFVNAFGYEAGAPESEEPAWLRFPAPDGLPPRFFVGMNEAHANRTFAPETLDVWVDERGRPAAKADGVRWSPLLRRR